MKDKIIDSIIFSGGTGLTPKDITYETLEPRLEKKFDGFGEFKIYLFDFLFVHLNLITKYSENLSIFTASFSDFSAKETEFDFSNSVYRRY